MTCFAITATANPIPQTPYFSFRSFPVPSAVPEPYIPPPTFYHKPTPVYHKPAPVYHKPAPVYHKPAPVYHKPAPVYHKPAPVYHKPIPTFTQYAKHPVNEKTPLKPFVNLAPYEPSTASPEYAGTGEPEEAEPAVEEVVALRESEKSSSEERMKIMSQVVSILEDVVEVMEEEQESKDEDQEKLSEKLMVKSKTESETVSEAPKSNDETSLSETELLEMAKDRLREMEEHVEEEKEELAKEGLVVLEPQVIGEVVSVSDESEMDGMNIVDFEEK